MIVLKKILKSLYKSYPDDPGVLILLGNLYLLKDKNISKAEKYLLKATQSKKSTLKNFYPLFSFYVKSKKFQEAEQLLLQAEKKFPKNPEINIVLANFYLRLNKVKEAENQIKKAIAKDPKKPSYYKMLSFLYIFNYKDLKKRREHFN